jgi:hypothetical protein
MEVDMASGVSSPDEQFPGWNIELKYSDWWGQIVNGEGDRMGKAIDPHKQELENRFDTVGWGLLFLLFAALALPNGTAEYASAATVGGLMLVLNVARIVAVLPVRWFSVILGAAMLVAGSGALAGVHMDVFVLFFVLAGIVTIGGALVRPKRVVAQ